MVCLHQCKCNSTAIDHLFGFTSVVQIVWQEGPEERSEPYGMAAHNDILLIQGIKDVVIEGSHSLEPVCAERLVAGVVGYVHVRVQQVLQVWDGLVVLLDPGGRDGRVWRRDGERVWVPGDFLQGGVNDDFVLGRPLESAPEPDGDGGDGASERR
mmetsp:Transcript_8739/g.12103  ORF Transcript_8739/g.12103 Transcript_8739/m.12103 type:complete len:155 (-) Transcript_8739:664-1128(-)